MKTLILTDWKDRVTEYLWLCLIHEHYGRKESFDLWYNIVNSWRCKGVVTDFPYLTKLLSLPEEEQEIIWSVVETYVDKGVLAPLVPIIADKKIGNNAVFSKKFSQPFLSSLYCLDKLSNTNIKYDEYHSNNATDIVYFALLPKLKGMKAIHFQPGSITGEALQKYMYIEHNDVVKMPIYRRFIRSLELSLLGS